MTNRIASGISDDISLRVFEKSGFEQAVLFWDKRNLLKEFPKIFKEKYETLARSWSDPLVNRGDQYVITVIVNVTSTREAAMNAAVEFAKTIYPKLSEFGMM